jgi:hypothetical protein
MRSKNHPFLVVVAGFDGNHHQKNRNSRGGRVPTPKGYLAPRQTTPPRNSLRPRIYLATRVRSLGVAAQPPRAPQHKPFQYSSIGIWKVLGLIKKVLGLY